MDVYIARQPIFNTKNKVYAYELLYRKDENNYFDGSVQDNTATSRLILNSYSFGIDNLIGKHKAFINFDKSLIIEEIPRMLDRSKVVIELLEKVVPDQELIYRIKKLKKEKYKFALDDFVYDYPYQELVELADIIKVDFMINSRQDIECIAEKYSKNKILLAEKVETFAEFEWAKSIGFVLFQGYYFSKPNMLKSKNIPNSHFQFIKVIKELNQEYPDFKKIASYVEIDVRLTYNLLKIVNSKFVGKARVSSVSHGLSVLGINDFVKWITLAMVQDLAEDKPAEIIKVSMVRAKFLELLAGQIGLKRQANEMMLLGTLSVIDTLLERTMKEAIQDLPISIEVKKALLLEEGRYTDSYLLVLSFEKRNYGIGKQYIEKYGITEDELLGCLYQAIQWAEGLAELMEQEYAAS